MKVKNWEGIVNKEEGWVSREGVKEGWISERGISIETEWTKRGRERVKYIIHSIHTKTENHGGLKRFKLKQKRIFL